MSAPAFTPGPWHVLPEEENKPYVRVRGTRLGERYKIANALSGESEMERSEAAANAQLIAAAPDLYEAMEAICGMLASHDGKPTTAGDVFKIAEATLAQARGETL
jgi:hypothetical protein